MLIKLDLITTTVNGRFGTCYFYEKSSKTLFPSYFIYKKRSPVRQNQYVNFKLLNIRVYECDSFLIYLAGTQIYHLRCELLECLQLVKKHGLPFFTEDFYLKTKGIRLTKKLIDASMQITY